MHPVATVAPWTLFAAQNQAASLGTTEYQACTHRMPSSRASHVVHPQLLQQTAAFLLQGTSLADHQVTAEANLS